MRRRFVPEIKPEPARLFCVDCREWVRVKLAEVIAAFSDAGGALTVRKVWKCPACRQEGTPTHPPKTGRSRPKESKGLRHNFEGIGGRRKGRPGRPKKTSLARLVRKG